MKTNLIKFRLSLVAGLIGAKANSPTRAKKFPNLTNKFKPHVGPELRNVETSHMPKRSTRRCAQRSTKKEPIVQNGFVKRVKLDCALQNTRIIPINITRNRFKRTVPKSQWFQYETKIL